MRRLSALFLAGLFFMVFAGEIPAAESQTDFSPLVFVPEPRYEFPPVVDGREVVHVFTLQNKGNSPLVIERVKTD